MTVQSAAAIVNLQKLYLCLWLFLLFVYFRNHPFDVSARRRTKVRRKLGTLTSDLDASPKGTMSIRLAFHKCDESKVLPRGRVLCDDSDEEHLQSLESISSP